MSVVEDKLAVTELLYRYAELIDAGVSTVSASYSFDAAFDAMLSAVDRRDRST